MKEFFEILLQAIRAAAHLAHTLWNIFGFCLLVVAIWQGGRWLVGRIWNVMKRRFAEFKRRRNLRVNYRTNAIDQLRRLNDEEKLLRANTETKLAEFATKRTELELFIGTDHYRVPDAQIEPTTPSTRTESSDPRPGGTPRLDELRAEGQLGPSSKVCG